MTVDTAATSSPEPFPESPGSDARLTRLHDALKQLRAKSAATFPLASISPSAAIERAARQEAAAPLSIATPQAAPALPAADQFAARPGPLEAQAAAVRAAPTPAIPPAPPPIAEPIAPRAAAGTVSASDTLHWPPTAAARDPEAPAASLESWFSPAALRQYRQLAGNLAASFPAGDAAAVAIAAISCRHDASQIAARLALALTERNEGQVLLVEPAGPRLTAKDAASRAGLVDVVGGRADWSDAIAPAEIAGVSLARFGSAVSADDAPLNDQWRTALVELKRRFRYLVCAARPGESFASDAWLAAIDGVFLAVALGDAPRSAVAACRSRLHACGARLLGCIALS